MPPARTALAVLLSLLAAGPPALAAPAGGPHIPEPLIFDMVRPMGAARGELEVNTLAQVPLGGRGRPVDWAPEIEMALADGFAVELELPFRNARVIEYKLGLQKTIGTFDEGRSIHGVQYLGIYDRKAGRFENTLLYMLGHRFDRRWSMIGMAGIGELALSGGHRPGLVINHATFFDLDPRTVLGLELNARTGPGRGLLVMPQVHRTLPASLSVQAGIGARKQPGERLQPQVGIRLIKEI
jgi:hypothetical protein